MPLSARPFFKFAGGKTQLLSKLLARVPHRFGTYHEPFVGGGALFWSLASAGRLDDARISDRNELLVRVYRGVREHVDDVVSRLSVLSIDHDVYYRMRAIHPSTLASDVEAAVWFVYLNKTGFNGLYRVNKKGFNNVPPGKFKSPPTICDEPNLRACSDILNKRAADGSRAIRVLVQPFEDVLLVAKQGDLVYLDPPYPPLTETADFTAYTEFGFKWSDQERVRDVALELKKRGAFVVLSNSDQERVRELYAGDRFSIDSVEASRAINSKAGGRGPVGELIIT